MKFFKTIGKKMYKFRIFFALVILYIFNSGLRCNSNQSNERIIYDSIPILRPQGIMKSALEFITIQESKYHKKPFTWVIDMSKIKDKYYAAKDSTDVFFFSINSADIIITDGDHPSKKKYYYPTENYYISWDDQYIAGIAIVNKMKFLIVTTPNEGKLLQYFFNADSKKKYYIGVKWRSYPIIEEPCSWIVKIYPDYFFTVGSRTFYWFHIKNNEN